jgi:ABC-type phosphate/phosphonate transport system substrate-binding protein
MRVATYLAPCVEPVYRLAADRIARVVGRGTELVVGRNHDAIARGEHHVAFICSPPALELIDRDPPAAEILAAPILHGERYAGRPTYFSDIIVRADDGAERFEELRGRSWAYNEPTSHSGYVVTLAHLAQLGATQGFFSRAIAAGFHQHSLRLVAGGVVDASAIDSQVLEIELVRHPNLSRRVRVIESLGPSPIQPALVSTRVPTPEREGIREALLSLHEDPAGRAVLRSCGVERFVRAEEKDYDPIRTMIAAAATARF